jgi:hypothetical protein
MHAFKLARPIRSVPSRFQKIVNHGQLSFDKSPRHNPADITTGFLVETLGRAHGGLDGQGAHVLPSLLKQRDEVVDGQHDVANKLVLGHADVANSDTHAQNLLQLELDGGLDVVHLLGKVLVVGNGGRELSGLGETGSEETRNLLDESVGGHESIVLLGELLDELLVLVELLQVISAHGIDTMVLGTVNVVLVTENANAHARTGKGGELDGSGETLVTLGVVVLEADLEFDGLEEVPLLGLVGVLEELLNVRANAGDRDFRHVD